MRLATNVIAFQAAWFAVVVGAASGSVWLGPVAVAAVVALHLQLSTQPLTELAGLVLVAILGMGWDSFPVAAGWLDYRGAASLPGTAPYWIGVLWLGFATTLNVALRWLRGRMVAAAVLGAIAGPLCYLAGASLGALQLVHPPAALAAESLGWAVLLPLSIVVATRFDGTRAALTTLAEAGRV